MPNRSPDDQFRESTPADDEVPDFENLNPRNHDVASAFGKTIERLYRAAISVDPTPRSQIAYACFLAEHGQSLESIQEFKEILCSDGVAKDPSILTEIIQHIAKIQQRMVEDETIEVPEFVSEHYWSEVGDEEPADPDDEGDEEGDLSRFEVASEFVAVVRRLVTETANVSHDDLNEVIAGLDQHRIQDAGELLRTLSRNRASCRRRRTGLSLLKLALFCGRQQWYQIEVAFIRQAINLFERSALEVRSSRMKALGEWNALVRLQH